MNRSFLFLFSFLLLPLSPLFAKKQKKTKAKIVKKKPPIKKSKRKRGKTPSPSQPPITSPQAKTTPPTHQSPQTFSPSYTSSPPIPKIPLARPHPTTPGSIPASTVIPLGTTDAQKTDVAVQKETLLVIQKIEPLIRQNSMNSQVSAELESIKKIITENKPLPKKSLILFAPDQQKIKGVTGETYTQLYRALLDYYKAPSAPQNTTPASLTHSTQTSSPITPPSAATNNSTGTSIPYPLPIMPIPVKTQDSSAAPNVHPHPTTLKKTGNNPGKKKSKNKKSDAKTTPQRQNAEVDKGDKQKLNNELSVLEERKAKLEQGLNSLIKEKQQLGLFLNQKIEQMNATEEKLKNAERNQEIKKEYDKTVPASKSFFGINQNKKNNIEVLKKTLERENAILADIKEESIALQASIETLKNNIGEKDNEIREQLTKIHLNEEAIGLLTKEQKVL